MCEVIVGSKEQFQLDNIDPNSDHKISQINRSLIDHMIDRHVESTFNLKQTEAYLGKTIILTIDKDGIQ